MSDSLSEKQFSKLKKSIEWSAKQLEHPRKTRIKAIKEYVGFHYASAGARKKMPVNFLALAVSIYVRQLAASCPRALFTTKRHDLKHIAHNFEIAINQIPDEIDLTNTLRRLVTEAMFSMGIAKVGLYTVGEALGHKYGEPFVDVVTMDDYFCDMSAKRLDLIDYEGNDYWLDFDEAKDSDWLDKKDKDDIKPDDYTVIGQQGEKRAEGIVNSSSADQYRDKLWLRDVWLPKEGLLLTYQVKSGLLLKTVEWEGPEEGPYYKLGFSDVPGNLLPLPPASLWRDLNELANSLFRKIGNQADAQKTVLGFPGGNEESVEDFKRAQDGDGIRYTGADPRELKAGGVDPRTLAFFMQTRDLYSYFAGNLDTLGGLSPQAQTLGQEKILSSASNSQLRDMADKTIAVIEDIFKTLAYYEWHDPIKRRMLEKPIPGTDMSITVEMNRKKKKEDFNLFDLNIDVYSLQDNSPAARLQKLGAIWQQYILPSAPMIQQAGGTIDVQKLLEKVSQYADLPEIGEIVQFAEPSGVPGVHPPATRVGAPPSPPPPQGGPQPGMTPQGSSAAMQQLLMGGHPGGAMGQ
jgi:hypothetical protein